tara:strand:+ start:692 stop:1306 length:615 start_codon:yes stop_codon:yes gene_type:complete
MPLPDFVTMQAQPDLLLDWLKDNILISRNPVNGGLGAQWVTFIPFIHPIFGLSTGTDASDNPADVYEIVTAGANAGNGLRSFICNYIPGGSPQETLTSLGDYCFTAAMNGCTFGISPNVGGQVTVTHANTGGNHVAQRAQVSGVLGGLAGATVLEPAAYRRLAPGAGLTSTTFGIRTGGNWKFYFQSYRSTGNGTYHTYGVMSV